MINRYTHTHIVLVKIEDKEGKKSNLSNFFFLFFSFRFASHERSFHNLFANLFLVLFFFSLLCMYKIYFLKRRKEERKEMTEKKVIIQGTMKIGWKWMTMCTYIRTLFSGDMINLSTVKCFISKFSSRKYLLK